MRTKKNVDSKMRAQQTARNNNIKLYKINFVPLSLNNSLETHLS